MDIPKQYTSTALTCRKGIAITSPIAVGKELGAHCLRILAIALLDAYRQSNKWGKE